MFHFFYPRQVGLVLVGLSSVLRDKEASHPKAGLGNLLQNCYTVISSDADSVSFLLSSSVISLFFKV